MTATVTESAPPPETDRKAVERRPPIGDSWLVTLLAFVVALVIGGILMALSDQTVRNDMGYFFQSPADTFRDSWYTIRDAYQAMFEGAIFDPNHAYTASLAFRPISNTIYTATPLIACGLGIALAFRAGLFNIGGQGQVIAGAAISGYVGFAWQLPHVIHLIVALAAGIAAGAFWGFLAGFLKARTGANEVITTIMLNWIAYFLLAWFIQLGGVVSGPGGQASKIVHGTARLPHLFGASLQVNLGIVLALLAATLVWWLLSRSVLGFRMRAVGANAAAAGTAGMKVGGITMITMALAGALSGLAGCALTLGGATSYQVTPNIDSNVGFDAITVALLGRCRPWPTVAAGLLLGALREGGATMQARTTVPIDIVTVIQALIVIFIAAPRLIRALFRLKDRGSLNLTGAVSNLAVSVKVIRKTRLPRHVTAGGLQIVLGLLSLWLFGLGSRSRHDSTFQFSLPGAKIDVGSWTVNARIAVIVLSVLAILAGVLRVTERLAARWCATIAVVGIVLSFIIWSEAGTDVGLNVVSLLQGSLFPLAIPLILGSMAGVVGERAGVVNVAIEGQLLLGAFTSAFVGTVVGSVWGGVLGGVLAGLALGAILAVLSIRYLVDQVIVGVVLNVFALGLTTFLFNTLMTSGSGSTSYNSPGYFGVWKIPVLGDIPIIGPVLFDGTIFLYATYVIVAAVHFGLFHTRWGLRLRAVGEHPQAADTVGVQVLRTRYRAVMLAGVLAGLGGAFLIIGSGAPSTFQGVAGGMTAGKGFIALAAVIFGRWRPGGAVAAALLFGFADQLQSLLSSSAPIDSNLLLTLPYVATILAVAGFIGRSRPPAADGQPYTVH
jgi:simple sugar transport system permease protein